MLQLKAIAEGVEDAKLVVPVDARSRRRDKLTLAAAVIGLLVGAAALASRYFETPAPELGAIQFGVDATLSSGSGNAIFAVSPDGRQIVFEGPYSLGNTRSLWIRSLQSSTAQPLQGTDINQVSNPFWSPDSRFIGFFADGKLKTISVAGGPPRILCDAANSGGGTWSRNGTILFGSANGALYRVPESGGAPVTVTTLDETRMETGHIRPQFMPDGRHFLFLATSRELARNGTYIGTLDSPDRNPVEGLASPAAYVPPGYLIFARGGVLMARQFDADRLEGRGEPVPLGEVLQAQSGNAVFSVSQVGVLAYQIGSTSQDTQLVWLTRDGKPVDNFLSRPGIHTLSLSPDHERAIVEERGEAWLLDGSRGTASRFTDSSGTHPFWSPDGRRIAFTSGSSSQANSRVMVKSATGVAEAELVLEGPTFKQLTDWSVDGRTLVFEEQSRETGWNVGVVSVDGDRRPRVVVQSRFQERMGSLSPDGRYLAYTSDETGRTEVYVVTYPDVTDKWTISTSGGTAPRWRKDGSELFFLDPAGLLISVPVSRGARLSVGVPKVLFDLQALPSDGFTYAIAADGQRILAARATAAPTSITVIVNWPALLNRPGGP